MLPQELGCGAGMTCWRRLRDWQLAGVWDLIHFAMLDWLARHDQIDWSRAVVDSCSVRAVYGGTQTGPNPTDRAKRGSKRHMICDGRGVPLAVRLTGANRHDSKEALPLVDRIPSLQGERGRPRSRPDCVLGDRAYDAEATSGPPGAEVTLVWVDRNGTEQPLPTPPHNYGEPQLSPDGRHVALDIAEVGKQGGPGVTDIWIYELMRDTLTRLTFEGNNNFPVWTPDGRRVAYGSTRAGARSIFWTPADSSGAEERVTTVGGLNQAPQSFSPDGRTLVYHEVGPTAGFDIWMLPVQGERKPQPFLQTRSNERTPRLSPDGRWVAYLSDESGRYEVYVRPFPGAGGKWQISTAAEVTWSPKGNELFFRTGQQLEQMMVVEIQTQPSFSAGKPRQLFEGRYANNGAGALFADYSIAPDGQRFLMLKPKDQTALTQIYVVQHWSEELKRRVPTK
jgi:Tol biopolymer transport system component